jgi:phosphoribosylformylglycinamidine synthase subunit PurL
LQRLILELARAHVLSSAHDVSDGGLAVCVAESCIAGAIGCSLALPGEWNDLEHLVSEEPSRVIVSFAEKRLQQVSALARAHDITVTILGRVGGKMLAMESLCEIPIDALTSQHHAALDEVFAS